jgi:anti-sigma B factor antagonist
MELSEAKTGNATVLRIVGRVDGSVSKTLEEKLTDIVSRDKNVVVDLGEMAFISSAGLRSLLVAAKRSRAVQGNIALSSLKAEVREVFDISGFSTLFKIYPSEKEALASLE